MLLEVKVVVTEGEGGTGGLLFLNLGAGYMAVFSLRKFIELCPYKAYIRCPYTLYAHTSTHS